MMADDYYKEGETLIGNHDDRDSEDGLEEVHLGERRNEAQSRYPAQSQPPSRRWANCYVVTAAIMASLGGVLFGYDIGIISGAILQLRDVFCLSCLDQELVISAMLMGAILGSLIGGFLIDHFGRRLTIIVNSVVFLVGAVILGVAPKYSVLVVGRVLVGFAVSVSATGECIYISEIAPANRRGLLVSLNELGITLGLLLAYLCNFFFINIYNGWRWMFVLSAIPALVQGLGMIFLPRSPRYLMLKKQEEAAQQVLQKLRGTARVDKEISAIRVSIASEKNRGCLDLCGSQDGMRGRMMVGVGLVFFQQFTGQPNVLYYAPTIFEEIGFQSDFAATLATVGLGIVKVLMTIIALLCVDRCGRRKLLMAGALLMGVSIMTLGAVCQHVDQAHRACIDHSDCHSTIFHNHTYLTKTHPANNLIHDHSSGSNHSVPLEGFTVSVTASTQHILQHNNSISHNHSTSGRTMGNSGVIQTVSKPLSVLRSTVSSQIVKQSGGHLSSDHVTENVTSLGQGDNSTAVHTRQNGPLLQKVVGFVALMLYVAAYGFSFGPVTWLVLSEIFPATVKGRAIAMATVFNWGTNLVVTFTFLDVMNTLGVRWTFVMFGVICMLAAMFIFSFIPETKNRTLEQISADMKTRPPLTRMRENCSSLACCISSQTSLRIGSDYSRVQSETVM